MDEVLVFACYVLALLTCLALAAVCAVGWILGLVGFAVFRLIQYGGRRFRERIAYPVARRDINGMFDVIEDQVDRQRLGS